MLSDWSNDFAPCRVERRAYEAGVVCVVRRRRRFSGMHEEQGTRGAHLEHPAHVRDLGRIEAAKRLVERVRVLPSQRERAYESERGTGRGRRKGEGTLVAAHKRCARRGGADSRLMGGQGASGAHPEHLLHVLDLGRVEGGERLVEHGRVLPSQRKSVRCGARRGLGGGRVCMRVGCGAGGPVCTGSRVRSRLGGPGHERGAPRTSRTCP